MEKEIKEIEDIISRLKRQTNFKIDADILAEQYIKENEIYFQIRQQPEFKKDCKLWLDKFVYLKEEYKKYQNNSINTDSAYKYNKKTKYEKIDPRGSHHFYGLRKETI